jgi:hypothetical protein
VPFINPQTDLINLGRANPQAIYYEAKKDPNTLINKRILEACSPELSNKIPDQPLSFGAGAFRIKSRIAFAHSLADFQSKLQSAISSLNDVKTVGGEDCIIYYWVVSSSLGGTGSGIFNDVLYHVNQLHHQIVGNGDPQLVYTMYMPKVFIDCNSSEEKYSLNAFSVFSELEAFKKMSYEENQKAVMHRLAFNNDYNLVDASKRYCPFYYVIPVDIQTDKGTSLGSPSTMCHNTAEMLYHLHNGQAGATFRSDIDNYMNDIMDKNHEEFLVPMGYVSLQKPIEQFNKYMRARFRRDVLRSWLLCSNKKQASVKKEDVAPLYQQLFKELDPSIIDSIAHSFLRNANKLQKLLREVDLSKEQMDESLEISNISSSLSKVAKTIELESTDEKRACYKKILVDGIWKQAEDLIREHGLSYTYNAIIDVRKHLCNEYKELESSIDAKEKALNETRKGTLEPLCEDAMKIDWKEKIQKNNHEQIEAYVNELEIYIKDFVTLQITKWAYDLKRDFCNDEKNDELSKLARHINGMITKADEMNKDAVKYYKRLATEFGETAMDVTTVYLPMLKTICDGNGWKTGNFFSKLYTKIITAEEDQEETPVRSDLMKFINQNIYLSSDENEIESNYKVSLDKVQIEDDVNADEPEKVIDVRFFSNPVLVNRGNVVPEKIIEDFITYAIKALEKKLHNNQDIQENWDNRKISTFFGDLTNEEKDEVRRSLNPALFFSYNNSRIDVTKKEEHIIFVAGSEDLAEEMLGYQKGNTRHRFEKNSDENTALVLKSKFGLALKDYRIYDAIKMVYDNATFREKYHFHRNFAQYLDRLTLDNLPYEILPQHRSFVKMLVLESLRDELSPLFYKDEYDDEAYIDTMYIDEGEHDSLKIALPEAFITDADLTEGKLAFKLEVDGRSLFHEIEGKSYTERFKEYSNMYHNSRFGETTDRLVQAILRTNITDKDKSKTYRGESILKEKYSQKWRELLCKFSEKKRLATTHEEKRLWGIFFNILREEYASVNDFKK